MLSWKFLAAAASLESSAIWAVLRNSQSNLTLLLFLALHGAASAALAVFVWRALPERYRQPWRPVGALLFGFSFFVPVAGLLGLAGAVFTGILWPRVLKALPVREIVLPEFNPTTVEAPAALTQGGVKAMLLNPHVPSERRLKALLVLQGVPTRVASPMLRQVLSDTVDDIRLVAYGMLDAQEKRITAAIDRELAALAERTDPRQRFLALSKLAELFWELVYQGLVQGDVREHALDQAARHAGEALLLQPGDASLHFLLGRMFMAMGDPGSAAESFEQALAAGLPTERVLPYQAEIAFGRRNYARVRELVGGMQGRQVTPALLPLVGYWGTSR